MVLLLDRNIERVAIVDDDHDARVAYRLTIEDADLIPVEQPGPMLSVASGLDRIMAEAEAVLCDQNLRKRAYAGFDGAEFVAACNGGGVPAVLCTQYERPDLARIRRYRRAVPVLLRSNDLEPDDLVNALAVCVSELQRGPGPGRRLWRAQARVVDPGDPDQGVFWVIIPAWGSEERIGVLVTDVPRTVGNTIEEGRRYHVEVNLGAESADEIYFGRWWEV